MSTEFVEPTGAEWDARAYHRLSQPQTDWGRAVLEALRLRGDERILDAGCGTGRLTVELARRAPRGLVIGADRSMNMLRQARAHAAGAGGGHAAFCQASLAHLPFEASFDCIFSTATFHWIPDHPALFGSLHRALRPGGLLLAQCGGGRNIERVLERAAALMRQAPFAAHFEDWTEPWLFAGAEDTRDRLLAAGFVDVETEVVAAPTALENREAYLQFLETIVVRVHVQRLPAALRRRFLDTLADRAAADRPPFTLDYWRLNLRAVRGG